MEKEINRKEIRGITAKTLVWALGLLIPVMIYGTMGYENIMHALQDQQKAILDQQKSNAVIQLQIDEVKADLKTTQLHQADQDIRLTRIEEHDKIFKEAY